MRLTPAGILFVVFVLSPVLWADTPDYSATFDLAFNRFGLTVDRAGRPSLRNLTTNLARSFPEYQLVSVSLPGKSEVIHAGSKVKTTQLAHEKISSTSMVFRDGESDLIYIFTPEGVQYSRIQHRGSWVTGVDRLETTQMIWRNEVVTVHAFRVPDPREFSSGNSSNSSKIFALGAIHFRGSFYFFEYDNALKGDFVIGFAGPSKDINSVTVGDTKIVFRRGDIIKPLLLDYPAFLRPKHHAPPQPSEPALPLNIVSTVRNINCNQVH
ncbi:MAG: hypothetical protein C5B49_16135 [Bdellovibrio sp.]|nr:MAG: hypothetical protein C5B49_16135 [Bdellovibrio sp.]